MGFGPGPIPWDRIVLYGQHMGLEPDLIEALIIVVRLMDEVWLDWQAKEQERRSKNAGKSTNDGKGKRETMGQ